MRVASPQCNHVISGLPICRASEIKGEPKDNYRGPVVYDDPFFDKHGGQLVLCESNRENYLYAIDRNALFLLFSSRIKREKCCV